jgi:ATP-binding cassette subfamily C (CFTR/MRP) protein 1
MGCRDPDGWGPISPKFDLTNCFLQGFLGTAMAVVTIVAVVVQIRSGSSRPPRSHRYLRTKMLLVGCHVCFQLALAAISKSGDSVELGLLVDAVAAVAVLAVSWLRPGKASATVLFYWGWKALLGVARVYGLALRPMQPATFALSVLHLVLAMAILFVEELAPGGLYDAAHVFARITFSWMDDLMQKGYRACLTELDLPPLPRAIAAESTAQRFDHYWNQQIRRGRPPQLFYTISRAFGKEVAIGAIFKIAMDVLGFVQPQLLRGLLRFVKEYGGPQPRPPLNKGFMIAFSMFAVSATQTLCAHQYYQRSFDMGMKIKTALTSVIYTKSLALSNEARQASSTGDIVNLMAVDVQRLQDLVQNIQIIWSGPFQIGLCLISLYNLLGYLAGVALVVMILLIPFNSQIARRQKQIQTVLMQNKDERSSLLAEIINNIKSLKFYDWTAAYIAKLSHVRSRELHNLTRLGLTTAVGYFALNISPFLVSCTTFGVFVLGGRVLSTEVVFPALSLFNLLSLPLSVLPLVISNIVDSQVAIGRITKFLTASELQRGAVKRLPRLAAVGDICIRVIGSFKWGGDGGFRLSRVNVSFAKGSLTCVVGRVGAGKSALLQAILGEMHQVSGSVEVHGTVAYVSQVPWIMNGTIRENILFGHRFDPEWYLQVLSACALTSDLSANPQGDLTEVGEKGISLSGGQKSRVALARAVYSGADSYIIDDTLSAVDEHVGKHIMDHVLGPRGLLGTKCRILATNKISVLPSSDAIIMISEGTIVEQGRYEQITQGVAASLLSQLISEFGAIAPQTFNEPQLLPPLASASRRGSVVGPKSFEEGEPVAADLEQQPPRPREFAEKGKIKWDVYLEYVKACNPKGVALFLAFTILSILVSVLANVWLKRWSDVNSGYGFNIRAPYYWCVYVLLGLSSALLSLAQTCVLWIFCTIQGSRLLHGGMATSVMRAPMLFFETTPIGRILNRFSNDIYKIDEQMGRVFGLFFTNLFKVVFTIAVICFSTWPFIFIVVPMTWFYYRVQQYYLRTSRELRRLDSITRSPIFSSFQESLNGAAVIRAYGQVARFVSMNKSGINENMRAFNPAINANRWLAVRLEFMGSIVILAASGLSIVTLYTRGISAGTVGLVVSYALQITLSLGTIVRMTVEVETNIVSVERVLEYSRLSPEAPNVVTGHRPPVGWPKRGEVEFKNYLTRYRPELDLVLKDISLDIKPMEKIGVVGRTGAGKSSLTLALFRIIERVHGSIVIDSVDIGQIGLSDLRHNLSIIPQDSQVFKGTIASNLDPTSSFTEDELCRALTRSHLAESLGTSSHSSLLMELSEGGLNLSVGQCQLLCLARAMLIKSSILVLDEATAAVDVETDKLLQETIRKDFKDRTIITIAHRLNTIIDSGRIIVLEHGRVVEFDTPANLLKDSTGYFHALCDQGGLIG